MKKLLLLSAFILLTLSISAQDATGYQFTVVKENPITSIKNQGSSGTCWSFSGIAFLESELLRMGKGNYDLSEMYVVRRNYTDKADKYIRVGGNLNFGQGGSFADVVETLNEYGVLPNEAYTGLNYGETTHNHNELEAGLTGYLKGINGNGNGRISTAWKQGFNGIQDAYFGIVPTDFQYQGKSYTAESFRQSLGLDAKNYISLTSFTHHPFYVPFALEIPDNWRWALSFNLPLDEMMQVIDNAINDGYTVAWASDVSEVGFTRNGLAVVPDEEAPDIIGSDQARWLNLSQGEKNTRIRAKIEQGPVKEKTITQEMRQKAFDNHETTDDHGLQIFGIAKDQNGNKFYMVKNSWGETGAYKGIWYVSEAFVRYKTTSIMVNKASVPKSIADKLNLK
jgi:aminopeptidase C